jgi:hypothetical protein
MAVMTVLIILNFGMSGGANTFTSKISNGSIKPPKKRKTVSKNAQMRMAFLSEVYMNLEVFKSNERGYFQRK